MIYDFLVTLALVLVVAVAVSLLISLGVIAWFKWAPARCSSCGTVGYRYRMDRRWGIPGYLKSKAERENKANWYYVGRICKSCSTAYPQHRVLDHSKK